MIRLRLSPFALAVLLSTPAAAQSGGGINLPIPLIEQRLRHETFDIVTRQDTRFEGDRTQRVMLSFPDTAPPMLVKWAQSARQGEAWNNVPRFEVAAYELQKLFLDEGEYAVPPTILRSVALDWYRAHDPDVRPTFDEAASVLVVLQYWLWNVTQEDVYDRNRFERDSLYARHFANANILTYLIRHNDSNAGNLLMSTDPARPRVFSVDNGVAFSALESDRGNAWRSLRVDRIPRATVERLRALDSATLERALGVLAEFEVRDGMLVAVEPGGNLNAGQGVRRDGGRVQFGLTAREIQDVEKRLRQLVERVDAGKITTF